MNDAFEEQILAANAELLYWRKGIPALLRTQTVNTLKTLGSDRYRVLLTIIPPAPRQTGQQAREALEAEGIPLFKQGIRRFAAYEKAALEGRPVYEVKDRSNKVAWGEYQRVGREILS